MCTYAKSKKRQESDHKRRSSELHYPMCKPFLPKSVNARKADPEQEQTVPFRIPFDRYRSTVPFRSNGTKMIFEMFF